MPMKAILWMGVRRLVVYSNAQPTDYDFSMPVPIIGGPKKPMPIPINWTIKIVFLFVIMTITTILNEHLF
jgi:hypothetical protein